MNPDGAENGAQQNADAIGETVDAKRVLIRRGNFKRAPIAAFNQLFPARKRAVERRPILQQIKATDGNRSQTGHDAKQPQRRAFHRLRLRQFAAEIIRARAHNARLNKSSRRIGAAFARAEFD